MQGAFIQKKDWDPIFAGPVLGHNETPKPASSEDFQRGFYKFDFNAVCTGRSNLR